MNYVIAVSGGIDSVVLLDMVAMGLLTDSDQLVVAHFDHGIRPDSADDAEFVKEIAKTYGMPYESQREELGPRASEEFARERRYTFLRQVAHTYNATIVTAHHADDIAETIAINVHRGTGWRGLAVLDSADIVRPLLAMRKSEIKNYANQHGLKWREDSTNSDMKYLRNSMRYKLEGITDEVVETLRLYRNRQVALKKYVSDEARSIIGMGPLYRRHLFIAVPEQIGHELLRAALWTKTDQGATRPQLERALVAIKTLPPGKRYEMNGSATLYFTKTDFLIE
jgi:tRNA(Ile)-lysidine synthetase-like protein